MDTLISRNPISAPQVQQKSCAPSGPPCRVPQRETTTAGSDSSRRTYVRSCVCGATIPGLDPLPKSRKALSNDSHVKSRRYIELKALRQSSATSTQSGSSLALD